MEQKTSNFFIQGIQQDIAYSLNTPNYLFDALNVRINAVDNNSLLSITNEKGNTKILEIKDENQYIKILNYCTFTDYFILFGKVENTDYIIKVYKEEDTNTLNYAILLKGEYNFNDDTTYWDSIGFIENEKIDKVYWIDGKNQPRVFKIDNTATGIYKYSLDFLPSISNTNLNTLPQVTIQKSEGTGQFSSGVLQYYITYSNSYLQESNIWYVSPLFYIGDSNKAASSETVCKASFAINIFNIKNDFDYVNIYGVLRTSKDATPSIYKISNIPIQDNLTFIDNGTLGESVDLGTLFSLQSSCFVPKTMSIKDNTLFFGNYCLKEEVSEGEESEITNILKESELKVVEEDFIESDYSITLPEKDVDIRTFKNDEWYRIGIQFMDTLGTPSQVYYIKDIYIDIQNDINLYERKEISKRKLQFDLSKVPNIIKNKYISARLVMVQRDAYPSRNITQGLICPTLFELHNRCNNAPFAISSWNFRTLDIRRDSPNNINKYPVSYGGLPIAPNINTIYGELQNQTQEKVENTLNPFWEAESEEGHYYYFIQLRIYQNKLYPAKENILNLYYNLQVGRSTKSTINKIKDCEKVYSSGYDIHFYQVYNSAKKRGFDITTWEGFINYIANTIAGDDLCFLNTVKRRFVIYNAVIQTLNELPNYMEMMRDNPKKGEYPLIPNTYNYKYKVIELKNIESPEEAAQSLYSKESTYYIDDSILTFHSIDIEENQNLLDNNDNIQFRIIGEALLDYSRFDDSIILKHGPQDENNSKSGLQKFKLRKSTQVWGAYNAPLWVDNNSIIPVFVWHRYNTLGDQQSTRDTNGIWYGDYSRKVFANTHYFSNTYYIYSDCSSLKHSSQFLNNSLSGIRVFNSDQLQSYVLKAPTDSYINQLLNYQGNVKDLVSDSFNSLIVDSDTISDYGKGNIVPINHKNISDSTLLYYKSLPHAVLSMAPIKPNVDDIKSLTDYHLPISYLNNVEDLPTFIPVNLQAFAFYGHDWGMLKFTNSTNYGNLWDRECYSRIIETVGGIVEKTSTYKYGLKEGDSIIWMAELYQDIDNKSIFGDNTKEILSKHTWIPIGAWEPIMDSITLTGYGDCFIGRYECLKTCSYSEEDTQSYIDIASFITESTKNPTGRYDKYSNLGDASIVKETEFNKFNSVYDQQNNLFGYNILIDNNTFYPSNIIWSNVKYSGEYTDSFTKVTFNGGVDVQGSYGNIQKLVCLNNTLYSIQDRAVYRIDYNNRIALSPSDNTPIIIGNNTKVDTPVLIKENIGISSPKNIILGESSLYLYDNLHKSILSISQNSQITNLSKTKNMQTYFNKIEDCRFMMYDPLMDDIYFQVKENDSNKCIAFNELLNTFTSFYSYSDINHIITFKGESLALGDSIIWSQRSSNEYCKFCNSIYPYYITFISNSDSDKTKIFNNINFTSNLEDENITTNALPFTYISLNDSYQSAENIPLFNYVTNKGIRNFNVQSNLRKFFKQWNITIPRNIDRNRFIDLWLKVTLGNNSEKATIKNQITNLNITYNTL